MSEAICSACKRECHVTDGWASDTGEVTLVWCVNEDCLEWIGHATPLTQFLRDGVE